VSACTFNGWTPGQHIAEAERLVEVSGGAAREAAVSGDLAVASLAKQGALSAQAHALLAIAKRTPEYIVGELGMEVLAEHAGVPAVPFVGARVLWLQERPGRPGLRVFCNDTLGTITELNPTDAYDGQHRLDAATARVAFDDGLNSDDLAGRDLPLSELLVVPGA
jgi:hypothetical protein